VGVRSESPWSADQKAAGKTSWARDQKNQKQFITKSNNCVMTKRSTISPTKRKKGDFDPHWAKQNKREKQFVLTA